MSLPKIYNPQEIEDKIYQTWEKSGFFRPNKSTNKNFSIAMPPPNATGELHLGHVARSVYVLHDAHFMRRVLKAPPSS